jgi:hypothetical protein
MDTIKLPITSAIQYFEELGGRLLVDNDGITGQVAISGVPSSIALCPGETVYGNFERIPQQAEKQVSLNLSQEAGEKRLSMKK